MTATVDELIAAMEQPGPLLAQPAVRSLLPAIRAEIDALACELDALAASPLEQDEEPRPRLTLVQGDFDA